MLSNLATLEPDGKPPETRVSDASKAYQIFETLRQADYASSYLRARIQALIDGSPPYDDQELIDSGRAFQYNVNWGRAKACLDQSMAAPIDLINSIETFFYCPTKYGDPADRREWEQGISEEITVMMREWSAFDSNYQRLWRARRVDGIGIALMEDEFSWKWYASDLSDVKIPRKTKANPEEIQVMGALRFMQPPQLWKYIKDEGTAKDVGWNVELCQQAIMNSVWTGNNFVYYSRRDWEKLEVEFKNNDLYYYGAADNDQIRIVNLFVQEFNGSITHLMLTDDIQATDFLYQKIGRFKDWNQVGQFFCEGVGTNGYYHSIRGMGYDIFAQVTMMDQLTCRLSDGANLSSGIMLQPQDENALANMQLTYFGPACIVSPGMQVVPMEMPNYAQTVIPVLNELRQLFQTSTAPYGTVPFEPSDKERGELEVQSDLASAAKMPLANLNLFYPPWTNLLREQVRRMLRRDYAADEPGGREVIEMKKRLKERGIPLEAFYELDLPKLRATRAIGSGSEAARIMAYNRLVGFFGALDDVGKANLMRDLFAEYVGYTQVDRYVQKPNAAARPPEAKSIADLQNVALLVGGVVAQTVVVEPNDNHFVHATQHLMALMPIIQQAQQDPNQIAQLLQGTQALLDHTTQHVAYLSQDALYKQQAAEMRKDLQQGNEIIHNGILHLQKLQRQALSQGGSSGGTPQPGQGGSQPQGQPSSPSSGSADPGSPEANPPQPTDKNQFFTQQEAIRNQADLAKRQAEIDAIQKKSQVENWATISQTQQKIALADAKAAAQVSPNQPNP